MGVVHVLLGNVEVEAADVLGMVVVMGRVEVLSVLAGKVVIVGIKEDDVVKLNVVSVFW